MAIGMQAAAQTKMQKKGVKRRGQFMEVWHRLKKNKLAVAGLIILILLFCGDGWGCGNSSNNNSCGCCN